MSGKERLRRRLRRGGRTEPPPADEPAGSAEPAEFAEPADSAEPAEFAERAEYAERAERGQRSGPARIPGRPGGHPHRPPPAHRPTPQDLAGLTGAFALTAGVHDPEPVDVPAEDTQTERGLRGLVGSGSSQVNVTAALRARDASRPTEDDLAAAETQLVIVRRGWVPREDLPRPMRH